MSNIKIGKMVIGMCATNCFFLYKEDEKKAIVIDAPDEGKEICSKLRRNGISVAALLLTHGHFDHIWGASDLRQAASALGNGTMKIYAYEGQSKELSDIQVNMSGQFGRPATVKPNVWLKDGEEVTIEGMTFRCIATPGHTEGSCCYYFEEAGILMAGDTLFCESVGRTDFPGGNGATLERSVKEKLFVLPEDTKVYAGHGEETTIGHEMKYNPFLV